MLKLLHNNKSTLVTQFHYLRTFCHRSRMHCDYDISNKNVFECQILMLIRFLGKIVSKVSRFRTHRYIRISINFAIVSKEAVDIENI